MKQFLRRVSLLLTFISIVSCCGCAQRFFGESTEADTLKVLSPEDIDSIFAAISGDVTERYPTDTDESGNRIVYWLEGGKVWHESRACGSIENAAPDKILSGTREQAISSGKERPCKLCSAGSDYVIPDETGMENGTAEDITVEETERYPRDYAQNGELIVYWLEGGKVWHESRACGSVNTASPEKLFSGTREDALSSGKERPCKICGDEDQTFVEQTTDVPETTEPIIQETTEKYAKEYSAEGELIVFWLEGSKVWHESRHCPSLSRSDPDKLLYGTEKNAMDAGKERACKTCS
jgi:hypothetical protein